MLLTLSYDVIKFQTNNKSQKSPRDDRARFLSSQMCSCVCISKTFADDDATRLSSSSSLEQSSSSSSSSAGVQKRKKNLNLGTCRHSRKSSPHTASPTNSGAISQLPLNVTFAKPAYLVAIARRRSHARAVAILRFARTIVIVGAACYASPWLCL